MPNNWEKFEEECFSELNKLYGEICTFEAYGKSDSTNADVKVITSTNEFFVEIKDNPSQCCQFVLFPNKENECYDFSNRNKVPLTNNCKSIIEYMDNHFDEYKNVNSAGIAINISAIVLYGLVNDFYSIKNVNYFMTKGSEYIIFPINKFSEYFDIKAFYRKKKSGSSEPNENNNNEEIVQALAEEEIEGVVEYIICNNKRRCFIHTDRNLNEFRLICDNYTYLFKSNNHSNKISKRKNYVYELRRLSNTNNPNVICQLTLKKQNQEQEYRENFERDINI